MYVHLERPRLWKVRLHRPAGVCPVLRDERLDGSHWGETIGVVACNAIRAAEGAMKHKPGYRVESVNDAGEIELVVDAPQFIDGTYRGVVPADSHHEVEQLHMHLDKASAPREDESGAILSLWGRVAALMAAAALGKQANARLSGPAAKE